jgi:hypothetical protein
MSPEKNKKRQSHCNMCGKRLSDKGSGGDIQWKPGQVDDDGLYCIDCYPKRNDDKGKKKTEKPAS